MRCALSKQEDSRTSEESESLPQDSRRNIFLEYLHSPAEIRAFALGMCYNVATLNCSVQD